MKKNTIKKQIKEKKKINKKKRKAEKKINRGKRYFTKTKNITITIYFLIMSVIAMVILLTLLGILEI